MASENLKKQLEWFVSELINIRLETDGYYSDIKFNLNSITSCPVTDFDTSNKTPEEHALKMLKEIKGFLINKKELTYEKEEGNFIVIKNLTTNHLKLFLKNYLNKSINLFSEGQDSTGKKVLKYLNQNTDVIISGNSLTVFRYLLKKFGKDVTFEELNIAIKKQRNFSRGSTNESGSINEEEKIAVSSAISELRRKIRETGCSINPSDIIGSISSIGYKMVL